MRSNNNKTKNRSLALTQSFLNDYFPFNLAIDKDFFVTSVGPSLQKVQPDIILGQRLPDWVEFHASQQIHDFAQIKTALDDDVRMIFNVDGMHLTGQFKHVDSNDVVHFIGSPAFDNIELAVSKGLEQNDFCHHHTVLNNSFEFNRQVHLQADELLTNNLFSIADIYMRFDQSGIITNIKSRCADYLTDTPNQLIGQNIFNYHKEIKQAVKNRSADNNLNKTYRFDFSINIADRIKHFAGRVFRTDSTRYVFVAVDVTDKHQVRDRLAYLAHHDELTGLTNRREFHKRLEDSIVQLKENQQKFALLLIDLDDFKLVNDSYGHKFGDEVLRSTAERIRSCLRNNDLVARIGGDEFALLLEDICVEDSIEGLAERLIEKIRAPIELEDIKVQVGGTIGMVIPNRGENMETIVRAADLAMYEAKSKGKNNYAWYSLELRSRYLESKKLLSYLKTAIQERSLSLSYQPVIELATGKVHAIEALARWYVSDIGWIKPDDFIALAEEYDLISELSSVLFDLACEDMAWIQEHYEESHSLQLNFNVSTKELNLNGLAGRMVETLNRYGVPPQSITLELTESALLDRFDIANQELTQLKSHGISVALDDFGKGYSSLSYLTRLPVDIVKIDRSFTNVVGHIDNKVGVGLIEAVIGLQESLSVKAVAEGIETKRQLDLLTKLGCAYGQGYYLALPGNREQTLEFLRDHNQALASNSFAGLKLVK